MQRPLFHTNRTDKFISPKYNLLVFQVKTTQLGIKAYQEVGTTTLDTCNIPAAVVHQCCQLFWKILLKIILSIILSAFLKYVLLTYFYHSKSHGLRTSRIQLPRTFVGQLQEKSLVNLAHCTESRIVLKTRKQEKLYPPTDLSVPLQCHPQLLSVKFEDLVHSSFRNESSSMEINVSYFGVLHWQQWQTPASASEVLSWEFCKISKHTFLTKHLWTTASVDLRCNQGLTHTNCRLGRILKRLVTSDTRRNNKIMRFC